MSKKRLKTLSAVEKVLMFESYFPGIVQEDNPPTQYKGIEKEELDYLNLIVVEDPFMPMARRIE
ncbi:MAG: hypothetical protein WD876_00050 [Candidatus Pacearchaeota archaeon]